jgi:palmitoyltransferase ZDHHC9/14/18
MIELALAGVTCLAFTFAACTDPGIVFSELYDNVELEEGGGGSKNLCTLCNVVRPPGVTHCYDCDVCVEELDHHCPWTGKCIGKKNLRCFHLFLTSLFGLIFFSIAGLIMMTMIGDK